MLHMTLSDPHIVENFEAALALRKSGFSDEEINALYKQQLEKDMMEGKDADDHG